MQQIGLTSAANLKWLKGCISLSRQLGDVNMLEIYKMKTKLPHIGIFWVYKSTVLAKAMPLNSAEPDSLSLYDSDFSHIVEWEDHRIYLPCFPELIAVEYQEISRGRVIYSGNSTSFKIYADREVVESVELQNLICDKFDLIPSQCTWKLDKHYRIFSS